MSVRTLLAAAAAVGLLGACGGGSTRQEGGVRAEADADPAGPGHVASGPVASGPVACATPPGAARLTPVDGAYFGVSLDWDHDSPEAYAGRLGREPAVYVQFAPFPVDAAARGHLDAAVDSIAAHGATMLLTLEPHGGLTMVTPEAAEELAGLVAGYGRRGVPVFVRFGHEMNGSWYSWSQDPSAYVRAFRTVADALHRLAPGSATVWAPNYGGGYPFAGGRYGAEPGTPAYRILDTDADGTISMADDPYGPYWPGDDAVDWVGMSIYHWGSAYPWGENEEPEAGKFADLLTGDYRGLGGDERAVPDFYATYGDGHAKPVAVTETAALYVPGRGGAPEAGLKAAWWQQVTDPGVSQRFPRLGMVNWFEWDKDESEVGGRVDWTVTRSAELAGAFAADLPGTFRFAADDRCEPVSGTR